MSLNKKEIFSLLSEVPDPEVPVLSIVDLGIVRDVEIRIQKNKISHSEQEKTTAATVTTAATAAATVTATVTAAATAAATATAASANKTPNSQLKLIITITPTYTGCPAMKVIEEDIISILKKKGFEKVEIKTVLSPAWTTDWISDEAKKKLLAYGISPPEKTTSDKNVLLGKTKKVVCPQCGSLNTEMKSQFGSTACKALYVCSDCKEPFDYFKCI